MIKRHAEIKKDKFVLKGMVLVLGVLILAACGGTNSANNGGGQDNGPAEPTEFKSSIPLGFPLGSEALVATDPSTVSLAKGEAQFIEFFAFW